MTPGSPDSTPPLRRHAALVPLSREHMSGLVQARNLSKASAADHSERTHAVHEFLRVWDAEIGAHFDDEERMLLPVITDARSSERLLAEHATIRAMVNRWRAGEPASIDPAELDRLGTLLHDHIRWEERVLFEAIQRNHPGALDALTHHAARIESQRPGSRARRRIDPR